MKNDIQELLKGAFFPDPVQAQIGVPKPDILQDETKPGKIRSERSVKDPFAAAEAQRIYNPNMGPVQRPLKDQLNMGTAAAMDQTGRWGKPQ